MAPTNIIQVWIKSVHITAVSPPREEKIFKLLILLKVQSQSENEEPGKRTRVCKFNDCFNS